VTNGPLEEIELAVRECEPHRLPFHDHRDLDAAGQRSFFL
jgi:hypothetical protein